MNYAVLPLNHMERRKEQNINDVLKMFLSENSLETPYLQYQSVQQWKSIVSAEIAQQTCAMEVRNETLIVKVFSPALCSELQLQKTALTAKLNAAVGAHIIQDIRFVL